MLNFCFYNKIFRTLLPVALNGTIKKWELVWEILTPLSLSDLMSKIEIWAWVYTVDKFL